MSAPLYPRRVGDEAWDIVYCERATIEAHVAPRGLPAPAKGPGEGAGLCKACGLDRLLISRRGGSYSIDVHGGPCEPVWACGHRDALEARWFEDSVWRSGCRECAAAHEAEET